MHSVLLDSHRRSYRLMFALINYCYFCRMLERGKYRNAAVHHYNGYVYFCYGIGFDTFLFSLYSIPVRRTLAIHKHTHTRIFFIFPFAIRLRNLEIGRIACIPWTRTISSVIVISNICVRIHTNQKSVHECQFQNAITHLSVATTQLLFVVLFFCSFFFARQFRSYLHPTHKYQPLNH